MFTSQYALPLAWHHHGANPLVPVPRAHHCARYDPGEYALHDSAEVERALAQVSPHPDRLWVVTACRGECRYLGLDFGLDVIERYLDA